MDDESKWFSLGVENENQRTINFFFFMGVRVTEYGH